MMSRDGIQSEERELSIGSERELQNLANLYLNSSQSTILSPENSAGQMERAFGDSFRPGSSRPPHHGRHGQQIGSLPPVQSVSPKSPKKSHPEFETQTSEWSLDLNTMTGVQRVSSEPSTTAAGDSDPEVRQSSALKSPTRRTSKKTVTIETTPTALAAAGVGGYEYKRELSDAYIESISRTPRYGSGSYANYEEMAANLADNDPFQGDYQPSGKKRKSKIPRVQRSGQEVDDASQNDKQNIPLQSVGQGEKVHGARNEYTKQSKRRSRRKKRHGQESLDSTATFTVDGHHNHAYMRDIPYGKSHDQLDAASVQSAGTYTVQRTDSQTALVEGESSSGVNSSLTKVMFRSKQNSQQMVQLKKDDKKDKTLLDRDAIAQYISDMKISQRECKSYARDAKSPMNNCQCGRDIGWHEDKDMEIKHNTTKEIWHINTHSEKLPCDSFGEVQFIGFGHAENSPYIRVCPSTDMEVIFTILTEYWKLPFPKLLISVTGGAKRFNLKPRLKEVFKRGLVNAATTTGAWIISGGTATGVMEFVGEAVRDHITAFGSRENRVVALGIATWGIVANRNSLDGEGDRGLWPALYALEDIDDHGGQAPLDHNHTHFILVDDGSDAKYGKEIRFRAALESYISDRYQTGVAEAQSVNVPVILLVVQGGVNTMKTVYESVKNGIPVLVIEGSGQAADLLALGYHMSKSKSDEDRTIFTTDFDQEISDVAQKLFAWKPSDKQEDIKRNISTCVHFLRDCLEFRKLINIFNLDEAATKDIDKAILYALLKANKSNANAQLALALAWNRCDVARHEIFTLTNREHWRNIKLKDAMVTALVQDRADFVQLFIDNGVDLKQFLNIKTLWNLYANCIREESDSNAQLLANQLTYWGNTVQQQTWRAYLCCKAPELEGSTPDLLSLVGVVIENLLGDEAINPYKGSKFIVQKREPSLQWIGEDKRSTMSRYASDTSNAGGSSSRSLIKTLKKKLREPGDFTCAAKEMFIWAILLNRRELAKLFWKMSRDQLGAALFAAAVLKGMSEVADDEEEIELSQDLLEHGTYFESVAVQVMTHCYSKDKKSAHRLLVRKLALYGKTTVFSLADSNEMMDFMEHTACQTKLNAIWKGKMALYTPTWKILICMFLPVFITTIRFTVRSRPRLLFDESSKEVAARDADDSAPIDPPKEDAIPMSPKREPLNKVKPNPANDDDDDKFVRTNTRRIKLKSRTKLYKVNMGFGSGGDNNEERDTISFWSAVYFFYIAPVTKFWANQIAYILFLGIFSLFLLTDLYPTADHTPSVLEYITWGWTVTMVLEEGRQIFVREQRSLAYKLRSWISSMWNQFDLAMYILFATSVILRFQLTGEDFVWARITYSVTLTMYYLRFMQGFFVEKNIGPKVIMIKNMLIDLSFFFLILAVFVLSFGVAYHANLYPNDVADWSLLKGVLYIPYWQIYGELSLETMEGEDPSGTCTTNETLWRADAETRCPEKNAIVLILMALYMIMTNVLLLNLLIAMFSYTFQMVQDNSEKVWRYYRFSLVFEYYDRPAFVPPFIILAHMARVFRWVLYKTCCKDREYHNKFKVQLSEMDDNQLTLFERAGMENYLVASHKQEQEQLDNKVTGAAARIEKVIEELDNIRDQISVQDMEKSWTQPESVNIVDQMPPLSSRPSKEFNMLENRIMDLSEQLGSQNVRMNQIMQMMETMIHKRGSSGNTAPWAIDIAQPGDSTDT